MYWNDHSGGSAALGGCLEKKDFTLEELLDHDDILQEVKLQNKKLIEFLEETATIEKLINLVIKEPANTDDPANSYRYPALACEIIASGLPKMLLNIVNNKRLLELLCSFLDSRPPLNPLLASFFAKTMQSLLTRHCGQDCFTYQYTCLHVMLFVKCPTNRLLSKYLEHMGTSAIMDTLLYTIQIEEKEIKQDLLNWLDSQNFIEKLISIMCGNFDCIDIEHKLDVLDKKREYPGFSNDSLNENSCERDVSPDDDTKLSQDLIDVEANQEIITEVVLLKELLPKRLIIDISENCASLLCEIISKENEPNDEFSSDLLRQKCGSSETVQHLLKSMFEASPSNRQHTVINSIQVLLTILIEGPNLMKEISNNYGQIIQMYCTAEPILPYFPRLKEILLERPDKFIYGYSNGIETPVGALRLSVIRLFENLLNVGGPSIAMAFVNHNILSLLLDMFVEYQWNSCLHSSVTSILCKMFEEIQPREMFSDHIFVDCALLDRIVKAWEYNDASQVCNKPRAGYMGHLIKIANQVNDFLTMHPSVFDKISVETKKEWYSLMENHLEPLNKIQNICLGGQHPSLVDNNNMLIEQALGDKDPSNSREIFTDEKFQIQEISCEDARDYDVYRASAESFASICEKTSNSMGDDDASLKRWNNSLLRDAPDNEGNFQCGSKTPDEMAFYCIASKLNDAKCDMKNYWMLQNACDFDMTYMQSLMNVENLSPWETNTNIPNQNDEWADFSNCENIANMTEFSDQFNADPFVLNKNTAEFSGQQQHNAATGMSNMFTKSSDFFKSDTFREIEKIENATAGVFQFTARSEEQPDEKESDVMPSEITDEMLSTIMTNITLDVSTAGVSSADGNSNRSDNENVAAQPSIVSNDTVKTATCDSAENTSVKE